MRAATKVENLVYSTAASKAVWTADCSVDSKAGATAVPMVVQMVDLRVGLKDEHLVGCSAARRAAHLVVSMVSWRAASRV